MFVFAYLRGAYSFMSRINFHITDAIPLQPLALILPPPTFLLADAERGHHPG